MPRMLVTYSNSTVGAGFACNATDTSQGLSVHVSAASVRINRSHLDIKYGLGQQKVITQEYSSAFNGKTYYFMEGTYRLEIPSGSNQLRKLVYISTPSGEDIVHEHTSGSKGYLFLTTDHLGSVQHIVNEQGNVLQELSFSAYGRRRRIDTWKVYSMGASQPSYILDKGFTGHQHLDAFALIDMKGRVYDPYIALFLSVDPLAEMKPWMTPYHYCSNNPLNRVDPTGALDDWVKNDETGEYEWMDDVTSAENTPEGYTYVGSEDKDILTDLNLPSEFSTKTDSRTSFGLDGDNRSGAPIGTKANVSGNIKVNADVVYDKDNISDNNAYGRTFKGVTFKAGFQQSSKSPSSDLTMKYKGYFGVQYGDKTYSSFLKKPTGTYIYETGTNPLQAKISISSSNMNRLKVFKNAFISVGVTNPSLFISPKPIKLSWNLMRNPVFLPKQ